MNLKTLTAAVAAAATFVAGAAVAQDKTDWPRDP